MKEHDYLIIGTGMAALTSGALLAHAGFRVLMLEAHDKPGGYAHSFNLDAFEFCAQVHYIWGCAPGQTVHQFLKHLQLENDITFTPLDPEGYDHVVLPDGKRVKIPYGFEDLINNIETAYPGQRKSLKQFLSIITTINHEISKLPSTLRWWHYITRAYQAKNLIKYKHKTLQDVFDVCHLSKEAQAVLSGNAGDLGAPPEQLSIFAYASLFCGYNGGAYTPTKHFSYFINRLAQFITDKPHCNILYNTEVTAINADKKRIVNVRTATGEIYTAKNYICNMDPQAASKLIGHQWFNKKQLNALNYEYSPSSFVTYIGVEGIDLQHCGFGNFNIWHLEQWDMNKMWKKVMHGKYDKPWFFISAPSLKTQEKIQSPMGKHTLEIGTLTDYDIFKKLKHMDPKAYKQKKHDLQEKLIDTLEKNYIPNLRKHIKVIATGTPLTNEQFCHAPKGNCYGSIMTPQNMGLNRLNSKTPWKNFHWCNASAGYAGIHGTITTGIALYTNLTGDHVLLDKNKRPSMSKTIHYAKHGD